MGIHSHTPIRTWHYCYTDDVFIRAIGAAVGTYPTNACFCVFSQTDPNWQEATSAKTQLLVDIHGDTVIVCLLVCHEHGAATGLAFTSCINYILMCLF